MSLEPMDTGEESLNHLLKVCVRAWLEPAEAFIRRKCAMVAALGAQDQMNRHGIVPVVLKYKALTCTVVRM